MSNHAGGEGKQTPGPWVVSSTFLVCDSEARIIAQCQPISVPLLSITVREAEANALLIARAPDLLAENERLRAALRRIDNMTHLEMADGDGARAIAETALAGSKA